MNSSTPSFENIYNYFSDKTKKAITLNLNREDTLYFPVKLISNTIDKTVIAVLQRFEEFPTDIPIISNNIKIHRGYLFGLENEKTNKVNEIKLELVEKIMMAALSPMLLNDSKVLKNINWLISNKNETKEDLNNKDDIENIKGLINSLMSLNLNFLPVWGTNFLNEKNKFITAQKVKVVVGTKDINENELPPIILVFPQDIERLQPEYIQKSNDLNNKDKNILVINNLSKYFSQN